MKTAVTVASMFFCCVSLKAQITPSLVDGSGFLAIYSDTVMDAKAQALLPGEERLVLGRRILFDRAAAAEVADFQFRTPVRRIVSAGLRNERHRQFPGWFLPPA